MPKAEIESAYDYDVHDAYHTLHRAHKIVGDKKLMAKVKKHAQSLAEENRQVAHHAGMLAKAGKISDKAMTKLGKMTPLA
jgi:signal-transduction protein with cAMP-binding, CBS, and nucleotidyltransferase domain